MKKCLLLVSQGDVRAMRLCIERLLPVRRNPTVKLKLPSTRTPQEVNEAGEQLLRDIAAGRIAPAEGETLMNLLIQRLRTIEGVELEKRIERLEEKAEEQRGSR